MRIALGIVKLFPEGGLQRDCARLARTLVARGHEVTVFTSEIRGQVNLPACETRLLPVRALTNHGTDLRFAKRFAAATADGFDRVVGFNKLIGLEFYYCADPSVFERERSSLERSLPRHRVQALLERESFGAFQQTHILTLTESSAQEYRKAWGTQRQRITVLQPSIDAARQRPDLRSAAPRSAIRARLGIESDRRVWLWIGAQAHTKGLDRVLAALPSDPDALLLAVGLDGESKDAIAACRALTRRQAGQVRFLGFREDVSELMAAADVLVHPSRLDVTGQVILEAIVNGLPAIVSGVCGFAEHIRAGEAGIVLPEPFSKNDLIDALACLRDPALARRMSEAGARYGRTIAGYNGLEQAAELIERGSNIRLVTAAASRASEAPISSSVHAPVSVIVTTYDRPDALDAVLRGLARQTEQGFEIIVADDGSASDTAELLKSWRPRLRQPLLHVWQKHDDFRAAEIRNRAILASSGAYCIFLDGDCIPRADFIAEHRELAEPGWLVVGNRVLMSQRLTDQVLKDGLEPEQWTFGEVFRARLHGDLNRIAPLLQARLGPVRKLRTRYWWGARSCNLAVWRSDLDRVDGFDNSYVGWGLEDSDLLIRLLRAGVQRKDGRFSTGVFHLWHPLAGPGSPSGNAELLEATKSSDRVRAICGLGELQDEARAPLGRDGYAEVRQKIA